MAKKKDVHDVRDSANLESYEKLRDELFHYRIEIKSYQRSIGILATCVSIVIGILAFFGYDRIESVMKSYESRANNRLAHTDSLLSYVDTKALDSLRDVVASKTALYEKAMSELEKGTRINAELFKMIIGNLPFNSHVEHHIDSYLQNSATGVFEIGFYTELYKAGQTGECHVVFNDNATIGLDDVFIVSIFPKNRHLAIFYQTYSIQGKYNRLPFTFYKYEQYKEYTLSITLLKDSATPRRGYNYTRPIFLND